LMHAPTMFNWFCKRMFMAICWLVVPVVRPKIESFYS